MYIQNLRQVSCILCLSRNAGKLLFPCIFYVIKNFYLLLVAGLIEQLILSQLLLYQLSRCAILNVRDFLASVVDHFNIRVSSFRDCFQRSVMSPRGWCLHCPSLVQIALSSVNLCLWPDSPSTTQCTRLFISPSGTFELDCATTKTYTAERSISIGRESKFFCTRGPGVLAGSTARG